MLAICQYSFVHTTLSSVSLLVSVGRVSSDGPQISTTWARIIRLGYNNENNIFQVGLNSLCCVYTKSADRPPPCGCVIIIIIIIKELI